jgi:phage-related protein (TIGR01555 family)
VLGGSQNERFLKIMAKTTMIRKRNLRMDGLENVLSRKGTKRSKVGNNVYTGLEPLSAEKIRDVYESGGIGAKIISRVADDITRKGFSIVGDKDDELREKFDDISGSIAMNTAIRWARAYGGALIVMVTDDSDNIENPLSGKQVEIEQLDVYEAGCSNVVTVKKYYEDQFNKQYGKPEIYSINSFDGARFDIHESRCIRIDGRPLDSKGRGNLRGWNGSELQPVYEALLSMFSQLSSGEEVLNEMVIGTLKMENLDSLCVDSEGEELLKKRLDLLDTSKSNENTVVIDLNEVYERHTVNLSGMSNIQHNAMVVVAGASDIPATYLFGTSPDGQNATGESDREQYYGKIDAERQYLLKPALKKILRVMSGNTVRIKFPSLQVSNLYDTARSFESVGKTIATLVEKGILTSQEGKLYIEKTELIEKISVLE